MAVGSGGFKTTVVPFIGELAFSDLASILCQSHLADQYDQTDFRIRTQKKTGEKVVSSRELTITYIYNAFYW